MKRTGIFLLVVLAAATLSGCFGGANVEFILGTWEYRAGGDTGRGVDFRTWKFMEDYSFIHQFGSTKAPEAFMGRFDVVETQGNELTLSLEISLASEGVLREDSESITITIDPATDTITINGDTYTRIPAHVTE